MRYVPNLIPPAAKVLPGYFKGNIYAAKPSNSAVTLMLWTAGLIFFMIALGNLSHPLLSLIYGAIGLILLPPGHQFIQRTFRFQLTPILKYMSAAVLLLAAMPLTGSYATADAKKAAALQLQLDQEAAQKVAFTKAAQDKKDSLHFYLTAATLPAATEATQKIEYASKFAASDSDQVLIAQAKTHVAAAAIFTQVQQGHFEAALPALNELITADKNNTELLYQRAICYSKTGQTENAVHDLAPLVQAGNEEAIKLHDKINPVTKHIAYYTTRCRDGSSSAAKGRGACSAHGGVANWNEPVYETSRKY